MAFMFYFLSEFCNKFLDLPSGDTTRHHKGLWRNNTPSHRTLATQHVITPDSGDTTHHAKGKSPITYITVPVNTIPMHNNDLPVVAEVSTHSS